MLNNGVDVLVASQRLGHAQPSITLDVYEHLMPSMQSEAANLLDTLITG
jgi:integrase